MASLNIPYSFTNGTIANATEVDAVNVAIKAFVETETVQRDGSVKAGVNSLSDELIQLLCPTGSISPFAGAVAPAGWLLCDGTTSTAGYPALAAMVGATTPNLAGRTLIGAGSGVGLTTRVLNSIGGSETHILTESELASHTHIQNQHNHTATVTTTANQSAHNHELLVQGGSGNPGSVFSLTSVSNREYASTPFIESTDPNITASSTISIANNTPTNQNTGSGTAHNNMQPFRVVNYIIKT
jgi:microcystin-dependent protein